MSSKKKSSNEEKLSEASSPLPAGPAEESVEKTEKAKPAPKKKAVSPTEKSEKPVKKVTAKKAIEKKPTEKKVAEKKVAEKKVVAKKAAAEKPLKKAAPKKAAKAASETAKPVTTKAVTKKVSDKISALKKIVFLLRYHTKFGQTIWVTGNHPLLGNNNPELAFPLEFNDSESWVGTLVLPEGETLSSVITYHYLVKEPDGFIVTEWGKDKKIDPAASTKEELLLIDTWNYAGYYENTFYTEPFQEVLLKNNKTNFQAQQPSGYTHTFKIKAPLLAPNEILCITGSDAALGEWDVENPKLMNHSFENEWYELSVDFSDAKFPIAYKYGVYNVAEKKFVKFEHGENRYLIDSISKEKQTIVNDGFAWLPNDAFKGAGVAIPVFSLRSNDGLGVGEFNDIKKLVDWAAQAGIKLVQILPVNDTSATFTNADSYPYASISAFALHPIYMHLPAVVESENKHLLESLDAKKTELNQLAELDYTEVLNTKLEFIRQVFPLQKEKTFSDTTFKHFFKENEHWLVPYAAFCYFRDTYKTSDFTQWPDNQEYNEKKIFELASKPESTKDEIAIQYFIQYHLHLQLKEANSYAHTNGIIVKGDIPIGIYRYSADAWQEPKLYNMDMQAGAPPDDFAVKGQNWGFPTYNWKQMQKDGFDWWKRRFKQMSYYFDAFRIDHILGFFRIWSIPMHSVEGIMGHFVPALPVHVTEFAGTGITFDYTRLIKPYITKAVLGEIFGDRADFVAGEYLMPASEEGMYDLQPAFDTQKKVEAFFAGADQNEENAALKQGLYDLISNVVLFEEDGPQSEAFHFRIGIDKTSSFQHLPNDVKKKMWELYINYFFRRQDHYWMEEAMHKLPELKSSTNMLICGEDLGMVPDCVPGVMKQLGILSLEIQRMPKDVHRPFFHPNDAPYLSVVTPSTHDMSTIRGWWEEDRHRTQQFFNNELGQFGMAPESCEAWINKAVVLQHLYSPAMWSIFQLQDILGISEKLRRENPHEERINIPADPKHYWCYRMHLTLEELIKETEFTDELNNYISGSGR